MATAEDVIESALAEQGLVWERVAPKTFAVALPGERRLKTACILTVGTHALEIEAFVMREPDENADRVHTWLLQRNARMYGVAFSIDSVGDIYLAGRVPLAAVSADELDRVLGAVLEYADGSFNLLIEMGFGSSIRREWAWRLKNHQPTQNLAAFTRLRPAEDLDSA